LRRYWKREEDNDPAYAQQQLQQQQQQQELQLQQDDSDQSVFGVRPEWLQVSRVLCVRYVM
jgi:hypothetical protein